jgi:hypothetical protein
MHHNEQNKRPFEWSGVGIGLELLPPKVIDFIFDPQVEEKLLRTYSSKHVNWFFNEDANRYEAVGSSIGADNVLALCVSGNDLTYVNEAITDFAETRQQSAALVAEGDQLSYDNVVEATDAVTKKIGSKIMIATVFGYTDVSKFIKDHITNRVNRIMANIAPGAGQRKIIAYSHITGKTDGFNLPASHHQSVSAEEGEIINQPRNLKEIFPTAKISVDLVGLKRRQ